jgi:hypothetical protein
LAFESPFCSLIFFTQSRQERIEFLHFLHAFASWREIV